MPLEPQLCSQVGKVQPGLGMRTLRLHMSTFPRLEACESRSQHHLLSQARPASPLTLQRQHLTSFHLAKITGLAHGNSKAEYHYGLMSALLLIPAFGLWKDSEYSRVCDLNTAIVLFATIA